jgi:D-sedoheptulose 7-phosphate isomerase
MNDRLANNINAARDLLKNLGTLAAPLDAAAQLIERTLLAGGAVLACGNGGSACDASHLTGEIAGRYVIKRPGYRAIDLTTNSSLVTALINDYPPDEVFARQVDAIGQAKDVLVVFSTSGNSDNVVLALAAAKAKGMKTVAFLGRDGGRCRDIADIELLVAHDTTARIQEAHLLLYHTICESIDQSLADAAR